MTRNPRLLSDFTVQERYRLLVDAVTDYAIYMLDEGGFVASWNAGAQRLKGYTDAEILGRHVSTFYTPDDLRSGLPGRLLATAAREGRSSAEGWRVRKDGTHFWAYVVIDPIRAPSGDLLGYAKVTRDLTERKAAEASLNRSEQQFRLLVQGVTDYAIYMLDRHGVVTSWNAGAHRIKGYSPDEVIGTHFSRFYRPEDRARGLPEIALATAEREGRFESEGWRIRKDGTQFWANVVVDPIRDDGGDIIGFAKVTRDVTDKRETQAALEQTREALFQSQKLEAIGQLTGGIAHDFNNLLMVVISSLELARRHLPDAEKLTRFIETAMQGAKRGVSLTQRMLAFARRQDLKPAAVDVELRVQGMMDLLIHSLGPAIRIETTFSSTLPRVLVDPNQLDLAMLNLVVNGRDAMADGGLLRITAAEALAGTEHPKLAAGRYVRLSVIDTGKGMDPATVARATEPFFTTKGVGKGTGLGLPMVHGLAAQSGGQFVLRSVPGQGTTAELWLPIAEAGEDASAPATPEDRRRGTSLMVLAVDDDNLVLMNTVAMLEELGHSAMQASSGAEALALLQREPDVQLLITDQAMPEMTGAQLIEAARRAASASPERAGDRLCRAAAQRRAECAPIGQAVRSGGTETDDRSGGSERAELS